MNIEEVRKIDDIIFKAQMEGGDPSKYRKQIIQLHEAEIRELLSQMIFEKEDVHIFDTSYGCNLVRIDHIFLNEDSTLWQMLLKKGG